MGNDISYYDKFIDEEYNNQSINPNIILKAINPLPSYFKYYFNHHTMMRNLELKFYFECDEHISYQNYYRYHNGHPYLVMNEYRRSLPPKDKYKLNCGTLKKNESVSLRHPIKKYIYHLLVNIFVEYFIYISTDQKLIKIKIFFGEIYTTILDDDIDIDLNDTLNFEEKNIFNKKVIYMKNNKQKKIRI